MKNSFTTMIVAMLFLGTVSNAQNMEVTGQMKVKQMPVDNAAEELVVKQSDGTLAKRSVASLISSSTAVDSVKSFQRDMDLLQTLCQCQDKDIPPFMLKRLMAHGYTEDDLLGAGIPKRSIDALKPVLDGSGNEYTIVTIGDQTWLKENLRTTNYNDGTPIPFVSSGASWSTAATAEQPAVCWPEDNPANAEGYGGLYNYFAFRESNSKRVCPLGYRMAASEDFLRLTNTLNSLSVNTLGSSSNAVISFNELSLGGAIKSSDLTYWNSPNEASNSSGLGIPGAGRRLNNGTFDSFKTRAYLRRRPPFSSVLRVVILQNSSTELEYVGPGTTTTEVPFGNGISVRCVKTQ